MLIKNSLMTVCFCLMTAPAFASETIYNCDLRAWGRGGWAPDKLDMALSADRQTARVIDRFISYVYDAPLRVAVGSAPGGKLRMRWGLALPTRSNYETSVSYDLVFDPADNSVTMRVRPSDDLPDRGARGTCVMRP